MLVLLSTLLVLSVTANPIQKSMDDVVFGNAVDVSQLITEKQYRCLIAANYDRAYVRAYSPAGQGTFDDDCVENLFNAYNGDDRKNEFGTEVYMTPQPLGTKAGATQLNETYHGLHKGGITPMRVWLQVVSPSKWSTSSSNNIQFIQSYMKQLTVLGINGGIFTSQNEWTSITNNWNGASSLALW